MKIVRRGAQKFIIPDRVKPNKDRVSSSISRDIANILGALIDEKNGIDQIESTPDTAHLNSGKQMAYGSHPKELDQVAEASKPGAPIYASNINILINTVNKLAREVGGAKKLTLQKSPCQYPKMTNLINKINDVSTLENRAPEPDEIHPKPITEPGTNIIKYTEIGKELGFIIYVNSDDIAQYRVCCNVQIECPNRSKLFGWVSTEYDDGKNFSYICNDPNRIQEVWVSGQSAENIPNVNKGDIIKASTFNVLLDTIGSISDSIGAGRNWTDGGYCANTCQVSCQLQCQLACQHCFYSTCHNQNCGGWS